MSQGSDFNRNRWNEQHIKTMDLKAGQVAYCSPGRFTLRAGDRAPHLYHFLDLLRSEPPEGGVVEVTMLTDWFGTGVVGVLAEYLPRILEGAGQPQPIWGALEFYPVVGRLMAVEMQVGRTYHLRVDEFRYKAYGVLGFEVPKRALVTTDAVVATDVPISLMEDGDIAVPRRYNLVIPKVERERNEEEGIFVRFV